MAQENLRVELYRALSKPHGTRLKTDDPHTLLTRLNAARAKLGDPALKQLIISPSRTNPEGELWLIKKPEAPRAEEDRKTTGGGDD